MTTVPAQSFSAPARAFVIAAARFMPGVCAVLMSSSFACTTRTPRCFHWDSVFMSRIVCSRRGSDGELGVEKPKPGIGRIWRRFLIAARWTIGVLVVLGLLFIGINWYDEDL